MADAALFDRLSTLYHKLQRRLPEDTVINDADFQPKHLRVTRIELFVDIVWLALQTQGSSFVISVFILSHIEYIKYCCMYVLNRAQQRVIAGKYAQSYYTIYAYKPRVVLTGVEVLRSVFGDKLIHLARSM